MAGMTIGHPGWVALGMALVLIGAWMIRWANRHNVAAAMADVTRDAAISALRKRGVPDVPEELRSRYDDLSATPTTMGKAKKMAGYALRNAASQLVGITGFIGVVVGLLVAAFGVFYG